MTNATNNNHRVIDTRTGETIATYPTKSAAYVDLRAFRTSPSAIGGAPAEIGGLRYQWRKGGAA